MVEVEAFSCKEHDKAVAVDWCWCEDIVSGQHTIVMLEMKQSLTQCPHGAASGATSLKVPKHTSDPATEVADHMQAGTRRSARLLENLKQIQSTHLLASSNNKADPVECLAQRCSSQC